MFYFLHLASNLKHNNRLRVIGFKSLCNVWVTITIYFECGDNNHAYNGYKWEGLIFKSFTWSEMVKTLFWKNKNDLRKYLFPQTQLSGESLYFSQIKYCPVLI